MPGDQVNILMVDDQPQKLLAYEAMLDGLGERLLRAQSGKQAFEILLEQDIAVILLDVNMPDMDGFETASAIREHPRFAKTPIIFVTAVNTTDLDRIRGYEIGAVDYVSVPVIPEILRAKVAVFAELHRKTRELVRLNHSLVASERHMRAILETAQDAIITIDGQGVIHTINPAGEHIFQYPAAEILGRNVADLVPAAYRDERDGLMGQFKQSALQGFVGLSREIQGLRKDGVVIPLEVALSEVVPGKMYTAIIRDISRRRELEREVTEIAAKEQHRIGQELHDGVSQELTGLTLMAATLLDQINDKSPHPGVLLTRILEGLRAVHKHVRDISHGLIPVDVDAEGLRSAIEDMADRIREQTGIACVFNCARPVLVKDSLTATHIFHIVQEAVNNALRHGGARRIDIRLYVQAEALMLSIRDDGQGIAVEPSSRNGIGLRLMRYRANLVGGILQVGPAADAGTLVSCTIPLRQAMASI